MQFFLGKNLLGFEYDGSRLSGVFGDEKILGSFLSRTLPIFFGLTILLYSKNKISPVSQNIDDLDLHFQRRNSLFSNLLIEVAVKQTPLQDIEEPILQSSKLTDVLIKIVLDWILSIKPIPCTIPVNIMI